MTQTIPSSTPPCALHALRRLSKFCRIEALVSATRTLVEMVLLEPFRTQRRLVHRMPFVLSIESVALMLLLI